MKKIIVALCIVALVSCSNSKLPLKGSPEALLPKVFLSLGNVTIDGKPVRVGALLEKSGRVETPTDGYLDFTFDGKNVIHCDADTKLDFRNTEGLFEITLLEGKVFVVRSTEKASSLSRKLLVTSGKSTINCLESYVYIVSDKGQTYVDLFKGSVELNGELENQGTAFYLSDGVNMTAPRGLFNGITIATQSTERAKVTGVF